jgi:hypothetical protein
MPVGWTESEFENLPGHGYVDQGLSIHFTSSVVIGWFRTINICGITPNTQLSFKYRIVTDVSYPNNPVPANDMGMISVTISTDNYTTNQILHQINSANHTPSSAFQTVTLPIGAYSTGKPVVIQISCLKGSGSYYMDFDNFMLAEITGLDETSDAEGVEIYPNPAGSVLNVNCTGAYPEDAPYQILGISGNLIREGKLSGKTTAVAVGDLSQGIYLIRLGHENKVINRRWIKQ